MHEIVCDIFVPNGLLFKKNMGGIKFINFRVSHDL